MPKRARNGKTKTTNRKRKNNALTMSNPSFLNNSNRSIPRPPRRNAALRSRSDKERLCQLVCSQVDPFCAAACGAKRVDQSQTPSIALSFRANVSVQQAASTSTGTAATQFKACLAELFRTTSTTAGNEITSFSAWQAVPGYNATTFSGYRITSWGVHMYTVSTPSTADGVTVLLEHMGAPPGTPDMSSTLYTKAQRDTRYNSEFTWTAKAEGDEVKIYKDISSTDPGGWPSVTCGGHWMTAVDGETVACVEAVLNCEMHVNAEQIWTGAMGKPSQSSEAAETLVANVNRDIPSMTVGKPEQHSAIVKQTAWDHIERFIDAAAPYAIDALLALL